MTPNDPQDPPIGSDGTIGSIGSIGSVGTAAGSGASSDTGGADEGRIGAAFTETEAVKVIPIGDLEQAGFLVSQIYPHCDREGHGLITELRELLGLTGAA